MRNIVRFFKCAVTAFCLSIAGLLPSAAQDVDIQDLLAQLADPATPHWQRVERQIRTEWSRSGSAAMDLLYQRAEKALEAEDYDTALEHLTALTDHAPDFAEGWNARATALFHKELYGPALDNIGRALALNPNHFDAITGLAVILQDTGLFAEALEAWYIVRRLNPHRPEVSEAIEALEAEVSGQTL